MRCLLQILKFMIIVYLKYNRKLKSSTTLGSTKSFTKRTKKARLTNYSVTVIGYFDIFKTFSTNFLCRFGHVFGTHHTCQNIDHCDLYLYDKQAPYTTYSACKRSLRWFVREIVVITPKN